MKMEVSADPQSHQEFVEGIVGVTLLENESDVIQLIGFCAENNIDRLLLHAGNFPDRFFNLKSGLAGLILQKFVNYQLKAALVLTPSHISGTFSDFVTETNRGNQFRVFFTRDEAKRWLLMD